MFSGLCVQTLQPSARVPVCSCGEVNQTNSAKREQGTGTWPGHSTGNTSRCLTINSVSKGKTCGMTLTGMKKEHNVSFAVLKGHLSIAMVSIGGELAPLTSCTVQLLLLKTGGGEAHVPFWPGHGLGTGSRPGQHLHHMTGAGCVPTPSHTHRSLRIDSESKHTVYTIPF